MATDWNKAGPADFSPRHMPLHEMALPRPGEAHLWQLSLGRLAHSLQGALGGFSEDPAAPLSPTQMRFARRFYLRLILGAYLGIPGKSVRINRSNRGKPVLDESAHPTALHFSMAKSGDRLLIGFSASGHIGVDLEPAGRRARDPLGIARRYFSAREAGALETVEPGRLNEAFLRTWACKEAVVKASGHGLANQLCRFSVDVDPARPPAVLEHEESDHDDWSLQLVTPENGFMGAVATNHPGMILRPFRLDTP